MRENNKIDMQKNLYDITNPNELKVYIMSMLEEVSKLHPNYPLYGYDYNDGKLISVRRTNGRL